MQTVGEVKGFLDKLREQEKSPVIANTLSLPVSQMAEADLQRIEAELGVRLPASYRSLLSAFDWSHLRLGNLQFHANADAIVESNMASRTPFFQLYQTNDLVEIGSREADPICIRIQGSQGGPEGEIVYLNHASYPEVRADFVSSGFEQLIVCAATDLRLKEEAGYYEWTDAQLENDQERLFGRIMDAILEIEPRASETRFWDGLIRGF